MPLYIKDEATAALVARLASSRGITKREAVAVAVSAELARDVARVPLLARLERFWAENPLPPPTGLAADKEFYDALSGESASVDPASGETVSGETA